MRIKNPHKLFGEPVEGSLARFLEAKPQNQQASNPVVQPAALPIPAAGIVNPENYIILEARSHGNYSYSDLLVAMDKTHQGKNWNQTHEALAQEGAFMLTIRQFVDFLNLLRTGKAFDGRGSLINP